MYRNRHDRGDPRCRLSPVRCPMCAPRIARARLRRLIASASRLHSARNESIRLPARGLPGGNADAGYDCHRRDHQRRACARQCAAARRGAGADRRQFGGHFRHRLDRRRDAGAEHLARDRAALDVCAGACRRHAADRRDLARLWPPHRLHHRHVLRRADRRARRRSPSCTRRSGCSAARRFSAASTARWRNPIALPPPTAPARRSGPRPCRG